MNEEEVLSKYLEYFSPHYNFKSIATITLKYLFFLQNSLNDGLMNFTCESFECCMKFLSLFLKIRDPRKHVSALTARHFSKIGPNDVTRRRPFRHALQYEGACWPTPEIGPATSIILFAILQRCCVHKNDSLHRPYERLWLNNLSFDLLSFSSD